MRIFISGYGLVRISRWFSDSLEDLSFKAFTDMESRIGERIDADAVIVANSLGPILQSQNLISVAIAEDLGFKGRPTFSVENGGASGGSAVILATSLIKAGMAKDVLVIGAEKTSDYISSISNHAISTFLNSEYEAFYGGTPASSFAMIARAYLAAYGYKEEDLSDWPVLMHENAVDVPHAQLKFKVTREQVMKSDIISTPLRVMHSPPSSDGAAVLLISGEESRLGKDKRLAEIKSTVQISDIMELSIRDSLTEYQALHYLAESIERSTGYRMSEIDIIDIPDDYTISTPLVLESLNISAKGKGLEDISSGRFRLGDKPSVNVTGGTKARGHPYGATGVYQLAELSSLLSDNKVKNARVQADRALSISMGGVGTVFTGILLEKV
ncbi:MAG: thiolase C-terminal domain-containing protein [Fervidicoccaceae archaeon]